MNDQAAAARCLQQVLEHRRSTDQLEFRSPYVQELVYGCLRYFFSLDQQVGQCLHKPLRAKDRILRHLLLVGAYQLQYARKPDYAVVDATVNASRSLGRPWAAGLVNGVLRSLPAPLPHSEHPYWMEARIASDYPAEWADILRANNTRAPMQLRINLARIDPEDYRLRLADSGIGYGDGPYTESVTLHRPLPVRDLPGYDGGCVSVQDQGAQFAAHLLNQPAAAAPSPGRTLRFLDACAAPGGKLFHYLELHGRPTNSAAPGPANAHPGLQCTALEISQSRLNHLKREADRLGHTRLVDCQQGDATSRQWARPTFDRILIDAPCTGSGTIRRHPDIKHLRSEADIDNYAQLQYALLNNLWPALLPGGNLLYSTCSIFRAENDDVVGRFLSATPTAEVLLPDIAGARPTRFGRQLLPGACDGFYYALMTKTAQ